MPRNMLPERNRPEAVGQAVAFVVIPRFNMMALTATVEPLRIANYLASKPLYRWRFLSEQGGRVIASNGMDLATSTFDDSKEHVDVVIVCASWGAEHHESPRLSRWLRQLRRSGVELACMDLGAYLLARAGVVGDRPATLHWSCLPGFAERFPDIDHREQLFTVNDGLMTASGGTSGIDLMLHVIARDHGSQLASEVTDQMLHYPIRDAATPQRQTLGGRNPETHPVIRDAMMLMQSHIAEPFSVPEIAAQLGVSQRQLERLFQHYVGCSVVRFNLLLRLQHARVLLTSTSLSIREVSAACGFNSLSYFSHVFSGSLGRRASEYRQAWPSSEPAPSWPGTVFDFIEKLQIERDRAAPGGGGTATRRARAGSASRRHRTGV